MKEPSSPCLDCKSRYIGCHGKCIDYSDYKKALANYAQVIRDAKNADYVMDEVEKNRFSKYNRHKQYQGKQGAYD